MSDSLEIRFACDAMLGGLAEYSSMLLGFQYLVLVALGFYVLSLLLVKRKPVAAQVVDAPRRLAA